MIEGQLYAREGKSLTNFTQTLPPEQRLHFRQA